MSHNMLHAVPGVLREPFAQSPLGRGRGGGGGRPPPWAHLYPESAPSHCGGGTPATASHSCFAAMNTHGCDVAIAALQPARIACTFD